MLECQVFQQIKRFYPQNTGRVSSEDLKKFQEFPLSTKPPPALNSCLGGCSYLHRYQGVIHPDRYFFMLYG